MSAIANSYKMTAEQLSHGLAMLDRKEHKEFWRFMENCKVATLPYSGYVLAAVIPFLQTKGIELPRTSGGALFSDAQQKQIGVVACGNVAGYQIAANGLAGLQVMDAELRKYYAELYGHDWNEAANAMRQGLSFILEGIRSLTSNHELMIFTIH